MLICIILQDQLQHENFIYGIFFLQIIFFLLFFFFQKKLCSLNWQETLSCILCLEEISNSLLFNFGVQILFFSFSGLDSLSYLDSDLILAYPIEFYCLHFYNMIRVCEGDLVHRKQESKIKYNLYPNSYNILLVLVFCSK